MTDNPEKVFIHDLDNPAGDDGRMYGWTLINGKRYLVTLDEDWSSNDS